MTHAVSHRHAKSSLNSSKQKYLGSVKAAFLSVLFLNSQAGLIDWVVQSFLSYAEENQSRLAIATQSSQYFGNYMFLLAVDCDQSKYVKAALIVFSAILRTFVCAHD